LAQRYIRVTGYSWKTNQHGLTIDTVTAYELVLPDGQVKVVTEKDEDLWFALRVRTSKQCHCTNAGLTDWDLKGRNEQFRELVETQRAGTTDNNSV
jgi:hypothetical protein